MKSLVLGVALMLVASVSHAQFVPKAAYVKVTQSGKSSVYSIYLADENLVTSVLVYKAAAGKSIYDVDLKPGGGQIAFSEGGNSLKLLSYSVANGVVSVGDAVTADANSGIFSLNYSSDGSMIAYRKSIDAVSCDLRIGMVSGDSFSSIQSNLMPSSNVSHASFLGSDRLAYIDRVGSEYVVRLAQVAAGVLSADQQVFSTAGQEFGAIEHMDSARSQNKLVLQGGCRMTSPACGKINGYVLDLASGSVSRAVKHSELSSQHVFSADDSAIMYRVASSPKTSNSHFVMRLNLASGVVTQLTSRAADIRHLDLLP